MKHIFYPSSPTFKERLKKLQEYFSPMKDAKSWKEVQQEYIAKKGYSPYKTDRTVYVS